MAMTDPPEVIEIDGEKKPALLAWIDPGYPQAHLAPPVLWAVEMAGRITGMPTFLRYSPTHGRTLVLPSLGGWHQSQIFESTMPETTREDQLQAFGDITTS
jgi:hypothetical protein